MQEALDAAKQKAGGATGLSKAFAEKGVEITSQAISQWKKAPPDRVLVLEQLTGISRHHLRPDIYGEFYGGDPNAKVDA
ncbi:transcriptional regulator [Mesorhizobium silamurunense]|uniref:transcriptional regulator n=1 Tax=Mesorhizobium silamurunense TaxID=499528 RepID=UPI001786503B|nr:YdaS family helix-turn-helix protein [Mesorhizobium silamurunense]